MKCRQCGRESQPDARFCSNCGGALYEDAPDTTTLLAVVTEDRDGDLSEADLEAVSGLAAGDALLIINRGGSGSSRILIDSDDTTVGRHPQSDIFLDDITVSRHHARFERRADGIFLEDLGSLNGTYVNRAVVENRVRLRHGDEIQIGKYRATINMSESGLR